jgi:hypothetical protein
MQLSKPPKPKATRKRLKKELLSDDFKKRKIFWKKLQKIFWKIFHLTSLSTPPTRRPVTGCANCFRCTWRCSLQEGHRYSLFRVTEIWRSHDGEDDDAGLGCDAVSSGRYIPTFRTYCLRPQPWRRRHNTHDNVVSLMPVSSVTSPWTSLLWSLPCYFRHLAVLTHCINTTVLLSGPQAYYRPHVRCTRDTAIHVSRPLFKEQTFSIFTLARLFNCFTLIHFIACGLYRLHKKITSLTKLVLTCRATQPVLHPIYVSVWFNDAASSSDWKTPRKL